MRLFLTITIISLFACSHKGVVTKEQPILKADPKYIITTIKTRFDSTMNNDGEYYRLYRLSNDSVLWLHQRLRLYERDTFRIPIKK